MTEDTPCPRPISADRRRPAAALPPVCACFQALVQRVFGESFANRAARLAAAHQRHAGARPPDGFGYRAPLV